MSTKTRTALVTGAARGIGLATTRLFLDEGASVVMVDIDKAELAKVAAELDRVHPIHCDVSDPEAVTAMVAEVEARFGDIDCLVNNAGVADFGPIEQTSYEQWRRV